MQRHAAIDRLHEAEIALVAHERDPPWRGKLVEIAGDVGVGARIVDGDDFEGRDLARSAARCRCSGASAAGPCRPGMMTSITVRPSQLPASRAARAGAARIRPGLRA